MFDIVIRNGTVVDGTGAPARRADVAVRDGRIAAVDATIDAEARETIDATGRIVTPGFVDPHSHFDGQVTWDAELGPTSWHGVTTTVMGNCGVGFAPVRPGSEPYLIQLMEGVEDIPGTALHEGITWGWESFPEYLDVVGSMRRVLDVGASMPHGSLRFYVMGERAIGDRVAGADDVAVMGRLAREAVEAGALAVSSNRLASHRALDGTPVPGTFADEAELRALALALRDAGSGLLQITGQLAMGHELEHAFAELDMYARLSTESGRPVLFTLTEVNQSPDFWRRALDHVEQLNGSGAQLIVQTHGRPTGLVIGWDTFNPFAGRPSHDALTGLPAAERLARLADPAVRAAILAEGGDVPSGRMVVVAKLWPYIFPMLDGPTFEPAAEESVAARAAAAGVSNEAMLYDCMLQAPLQMSLGGYRKHDLSSIHEIMTHPHAMLGLADGGAHCSIICDSSLPSFVLQHWVRDRTRGPRLGVEQAVRLLTSRPAEIYALSDRGVLAPGRRADVNVIDLDAVRLHLPEVLHDLPTGAKRVVQRADGYDATVCNGEVTFRNAVPTGARPGVLLRGPQ
jgi:N-acyl-D-aspartate/D-glutamate deacylase